MSLVFGGGNEFKDCDYVTAWYLKAAELTKRCDAIFAFVSTSSISVGEQVAHLWSRLYADGCHIIFAHRPFKWRNNASNNAVVHCVIIGVGRTKPIRCDLYEGDTKREVDSISPYLIAGAELYVQKRDRPLSPELNCMVSGSMARDGGNLILSTEEANELAARHDTARPILRKLVGSQELVHYRNRQCLWIEDELLQLAVNIPEVAARIENVRSFRKTSAAKTTKGYATIAHKFAQRAHKGSISIGIARHFSEAREYLPADIFDAGTVISDAALAICNPSMWELAIILSKLHLIWVATVCGKLKSDFRYSNTLGWNTFPVPNLTDKNRADLTRCTEDILLAREAHFPATIADLYDPEKMPVDLREAHDRNDEVLERIYIGRRFRNDTERLEKLFELYVKGTAGQGAIRKLKVEAQ
jgi:hypothetical protein